MKKYLFFILFVFYSNFSFGSYNSNFKTYYLNKESLEYKSSIEKILDKFESTYPNLLPKIVTIQIDFKAKNSLSYSEIQIDNCQIYINFKDIKPVIFKEIHTDLYFTLFHEVGHCILGNKNFYNDFKWSIINKNKALELNSLILKINKKSQENIDCFDCFAEDFNIAPPIAVYHEIFSDIFSIFIVNSLSNKKININTIIKYRKNNFSKSPKKNFYGLGFSNINELDGIISFDDVLFVSEKTFYNYLNFIKKYY